MFSAYLPYFEKNKNKPMQSRSYMYPPYHCWATAWQVGQQIHMQQ
jgi:hypothetical protein